MELRKILASDCRQKILKILSIKKKANMMELVADLNSTYNEVDRNLQILERENCIAQEHIGHERILFFKSNDKTLLLLRVIRVLENPYKATNPLNANRVLGSINFAKHKNVSKDRLREPICTFSAENENTIATSTGNEHTKFEVLTSLELLSIPKPLRLTAVALFRLDGATANELSKETKRTVLLEKKYANKLEKLGYITKKKKSHEICYCIKMPTEPQEQRIN